MTPGSTDPMETSERWKQISYSWTGSVSGAHASVFVAGEHRLRRVTRLSVEFPHLCFQGEHPYPWPLFGSEPPPPCYSLPPPRLHQNSQGDVTRLQRLNRALL